MKATMVLKTFTHQLFMIEILNNSEQKELDQPNKEQQGTAKLMVKDCKLFRRDQGKALSACGSTIQHCTADTSQGAKTRKRNNRQPEWKERSKTISLWR